MIIGTKQKAHKARKHRSYELCELLNFTKYALSTQHIQRALWKVDDNNPRKLSNFSEKTAPVPKFRCPLKDRKIGKKPVLSMANLTPVS